MQSLLHEPSFSSHVFSQTQGGRRPHELANNRWPLVVNAPRKVSYCWYLTYQCPAAPGADVERAAGVALTGAAAAGGGSADNGRDDGGVAVHLCARLVGDHLHGHVAHRLLLADALVWKHICVSAPSIIDLSQSIIGLLKTHSGLCLIYHIFGFHGQAVTYKKL